MYSWVPAYFKDVFTAGMSSSQRSESINSFFDGYVHAMTPLNEFTVQYDKALKARRKAEKDEEFLPPLTQNQNVNQDYYCRSKQLRVTQSGCMENFIVNL